MTTRKDDLQLKSRTPAYVSREVGAAELSISPATWDDMVAIGKLPPADTMIGKAGTNPRWKWTRVEAWLGGDRSVSVQSASEAFFRGIPSGAEKDRKRAAS